MAYKEKECPKCGTKHKKRGEFCSRSCGNTRKHTESTKKKIGEANRAVLNDGSDESEVRKHNYISQRINAPSEPVSPPVRAPLSDNQFVADGDLWTNCE